jgi:hypothetical protein
MLTTFNGRIHELAERVLEAFDVLIITNEMDVRVLMKLSSLCHARLHKPMHL